MLCNGKNGKCNEPVEAKHLGDRNHYECKRCGEQWDTDPAPEMKSSGQMPSLIVRRPCTCLKHSDVNWEAVERMHNRLPRGWRND